MLHPSNMAENSYKIITSAFGERKVSLRKYTISKDYKGVHEHLIGESFRLISLGVDRNPGDHTNDYASIALDKDMKDYGPSQAMAIGVPFEYLEPI